MNKQAFTDGYMHKQAGPVDAARAAFQRVTRDTADPMDLTGYHGKRPYTGYGPAKGQATKVPRSPLGTGSKDIPTSPVYRSKGTTVDYGAHPGVSAPRTPGGQMPAGADAHVPAPTKGKVIEEYGPHPRLARVKASIDAARAKRGFSPQGRPAPHQPLKPSPFQQTPTSEAKLMEFLRGRGMRANDPWDYKPE